MIVYHGSNMVVDKPLLVKQNRNLDFGNGFYTTTNYEQAKNFALKVKILRGGNAIVNKYVIDEELLKGLIIKEFPFADEEWLDFVSGNRNGTIESFSYDLIIGPVADDDVYKTLQIYQDGVITKEQALEQLKVKELFNQYVFSTKKALRCIKMIDYFEVE